MEVLVFENQSIYAVERVTTVEHFIALCKEYIPLGRPIEVESGDRFVSCADVSGCHKPMMLVLVGVLSKELTSKASMLLHYEYPHYDHD